MTTKSQLEQRIIEITSLIQKEFPELSSYIKEMPTNNSENEVNINTLQDYYHSLEELVNKYAETHSGEKPK